MITIGFTNSSLRKLRTAIDQKVKQKQKELANEVVATALDVEREIKFAAPVQYGRLRASYHVKTHASRGGHNYSDNQGKSFEAKLSENVSTPLTALVGTDVEYAKYMEFKLQFMLNAAKNNKGPFEQRVKRIMKS